LGRSATGIVLISLAALVLWCKILLDTLSTTGNNANALICAVRLPDLALCFRRLWILILSSLAAASGVPLLLVSTPAWFLGRALDSSCRGLLHAWEIISTLGGSSRSAHAERHFFHLLFVFRYQRSAGLLILKILSSSWIILLHSTTDS